MAFAFKVRWGTVQGATFNEYSTKVNKIIEDAYKIYQQNKKGVFVPLPDEKSQKINRRVYFDTMKEKASKGDDGINVHRKDVLPAKSEIGTEMQQ